jgi:hypothetical protein
LAIHANFGGFRRLGFAVFQASPLIILQLAGLLTPTIIGPLGHPYLMGRIGNALTLRNQNVNFAQLRDNLFRTFVFSSACLKPRSLQIL